MRSCQTIYGKWVFCKWKKNSKDKTHPPEISHRILHGRLGDDEVVEKERTAHVICMDERVLLRLFRGKAEHNARFILAFDSCNIRIRTLSTFIWL
jgi:hypothetical protein